MIDESQKFTIKQIIYIGGIFLSIAGGLGILSIQELASKEDLIKLECRVLEFEKENAQLKLLSLKRRLQDKIGNPDDVPYIQTDILTEDNKIKKAEALYFKKCVIHD